MKRMLMLASVASMIDQFNMPNIELLKNLGYQVDVACNFEYGNTCSTERIEELKRRLTELGVGCFQIDFTRNVMNLKQDMVAYKQVLKILRSNKYTFLHCHSPIGGVVGRLAGHKAGIKVIYTAHGFHFFKGAPLLNWLLFYPIEKYLSRYTDMLITINEEDYHRALKKFHAKETTYVHGVGIATEKFAGGEVDVKEKKAELGIPQGAKVLFSVGELNDNKNHATIIKAMKELKDTSCHYVICGRGEGREALEQLALELGIKERVHLLGFRTDVAQIFSVADMYVFPSKREGLSVALMEAMASGLPIVASNIRGNRDLIQDGENGYLVGAEDVSAFADRIQKLLDCPEICEKFGKESRERVKNFDLEKVSEEMRKIYQQVM